MGSVVAPLTGHIDAALTEFVKRFMNNELVSDRLAPRVSVGKQSGKYWIYDRADQELLQQTLRATGSPAQQIRMKLSTGSFNCDSHALEAAVPDEDAANFDLGSLVQDATQALINKILLDKEDRLAAILTDTAKVTNNTTLAAPDRWDDGGGSPFDVIETGKSKIRESGVAPNFIMVGEPVFRELINHAGVVERFKYVQRGALNESDLAAAFGVPNFWVGRAVKLDKAGAISFLWGKDVLIGYVSPAASQMDISGAKSFVWSGAPGTVGGFGVMRARHPQPSAKTELVSADMYYDQQVTAVETLYLIKTAVA